MRNPLEGYSEFPIIGMNRREERKNPLRNEAGRLCQIEARHGLNKYTKNKKIVTN